MMKAMIGKWKFATSTIVLSLLISHHADAQPWIFKTVDPGTKPSIAIDDLGRVHIAYMLEAIPGFLKHARLDEGQEEFVVTLLDNAYYYGPLDISIGTNNLPAIVLHNHDDEDQNVYWQNNSGSWIKHRISDGGHDGWDNSIVFDEMNRIHTSSVDPSQFGSSSSIEYALYDGASWHVEKIGSIAVPYQFSTSIDLNSNNEPAITYFDPNANRLYYAIRTQSNWSIETLPGNGGMFSSLVFDDSDVPHVSYYERRSGNTGAVWYAYHNGNGWIMEEVDQLLNVPISFSGARNVTSLALDASGQLHLAYNDRDVLKYATKESGNWNIETILGPSNNSATLGAQASLALDPEGNPHITYFEATNLNPLQGVIKYTTRDPMSTSTSQLKSASSVQIYPSPTPVSGSVKFASDSDIKRAELYDQLGRRLYSKEMQGMSEISLADLGLLPGAYFLKLRISNSASPVEIHRLVLQ
ncbi:MAG: T9SS type A sorting domain-containing protein [Saprospiraceae bacterium]|nr:T9SS type A sorting domain-containing protein [Saprospiraceae bacterium]